jgi:hypothetical protein
LSIFRKSGRQRIQREIRLDRIAADEIQGKNSVSHPVARSVKVAQNGRRRGLQSECIEPSSAMPAVLALPVLIGIFASELAEA